MLTDTNCANQFYVGDGGIFAIARNDISGIGFADNIFLTAGGAFGTSTNGGSVFIAAGLAPDALGATLHVIGATTGAGGVINAIGGLGTTIGGNVEARGGPTLSGGILGGGVILFGAGASGGNVAINVGSDDTQLLTGDLIISARNASLTFYEYLRIVGIGGEWQLASDPGTAGDVLTSAGAGAPPTWTAPAGGASFPLSAPNGSCAAPSYAFVANPASGMFYTGTALRVADNNCGDFLQLGSGIALTSAANQIQLTAATTIGLQAGTFVGLTSTLGTAGILAFTDIDVSAINGFVQLSAGGDLIINTGGAARLTIFGTGDWDLAGDVGTAGEVLTSNGVGVAPTWQTLAGGASFPLLASDGSCAAPSYSFTNSPDSGLLYTGTAVRLADDNCADYVEVGEGIAIVSTANGIALNAVDTIELVSTANDVIVSGEGLTLEATTLGVVIQTVGGTVELSATGEILLNGLPGTAGDVLTSNGVGVAPTWQTPSASFPMLAPDGSCAAPSYSFASDAAGGMWFDPALGAAGAVVISDHNCTNRINVGASIAISSTAAGNITASADTGMIQLSNSSGAILNISGAGAVSLLSATGQNISVAAGAGGIAELSGNSGLFRLNPSGALTASSASGQSATLSGNGAFFEISATGATTSASAVNQNTALSVSGAGAISIAQSSTISSLDISAAGAITLTNNSGSAQIGIDFSGGVTAFAASGQNTTLVAGASGQAQLAANSGSFTVNAAGAASVASASGQNITFSTLGSSSIRLEANLVSLVFTSDGEILLGGLSGTAGDVLTSGGIGADAVWATPGGSSPSLYDEEITGFAAPTASGTLAFTIGSGATASAANSFALGTGAAASAADAIAIGEGATCPAAQGICIGSDAVTASAATAAISYWRRCFDEQRCSAACNRHWFQHFRRCARVDLHR